MTTSTRALDRAEGLQLLGALGGSGYRKESFLVRRSDGQTLQLTPLLYQLLELLDGRLTPSELAVALSARAGRLADEDAVLVLVGKLTQLGLVAGSEPESLPTSNPLLALRWKVVVSDPDKTRRLTAPLAFLFRPWILWPVLVAFVAVCWFVMVEKGLASATAQAFDSPGLLLGLFALAVASAGLHELGHAAACRYGGAQPGAMGAGLYLVYPAFYTNVTDSYRLSRLGRLRVDLGGLYVNALVAVATMIVWLATGKDALLLLVAMQLLQMVRQLSPVIRADGYHILADLTGVPDLYAHLLPTLKRVLPSHWREPSPLTRKAQVLVIAWVAVTVPVMASLLAGAVLLAPRMLASAWTRGQVETHHLVLAVEHAGALGIAASLLKLLALTLPVLGVVAITWQLGRSTARRSWRSTQDRPVRRAALLVGAAAALVAALLAWWPHGQYQPVRANERGTLPSLFTDLSHGSITPVSYSTTRQLSLVMLPRGGVTAAHPAMAVLRNGGTTHAVLISGRTGTVMPFRLPKSFGPGETNATAVNTTDGAVVYDVAYAVVTIKDGGVTTPASTAYAVASCHGCSTVAVSYQVVLIVGQTRPVVPVDIALAGNRSCPQCTTTALAAQLVVTLSQQPPAALLEKLNAALKGLAGITAIDPRDTAAIVAQVAAVQAQVTQILRDSGLVTAVRGGLPTASPTAVPSTSSLPAPGPSTSLTATGNPSEAPTTSPSPNASATPTATSGPTATPTPSDSSNPSPVTTSSP